MKQSANRAKVSASRLRRAVASSTAIETGRPVAEIEKQLEQPPAKFQHLTLAQG